MSDDTIARLEALVDRLEAIGHVGAVAPQSINPDGSPGTVVSGELIEAAWGNAVANTMRKLPRGVLAHTKLESYVGTSGAAGTVTMLEVEWTLDTTRGYKISGHWGRVQNLSEGVSGLTITRNGVTIQSSYLSIGDVITGPSNENGGTIFVLDGPSLSGAVTYALKLTTTCVSGAAIDASATAPLTLSLEDIGGT